MILFRRRAGAPAALLAMTLAACVEGGAGAPQSAGSSVADMGSEPVVEEPALAEDVFDATGLTIWDGAGTLQGVWLAHPLAERAQRVRVFNQQNGRVVEGALFRRDPALDGPSIIVSSDAARALGVTPGEPTEVRIVALREPAPQADEGEAAAEAETEAVPSPTDAPSEDETETQAAAPSPAPEADPAAAETQPSQTPAAAEAAPRAAAPEGAYLQVGSFSSEANATALVERLKAQGQPAFHADRSAGDDALTSVLIGPLSGPDALAAAQAAARAEGVTDAIEVKL